MDRVADDRVPVHLLTSEAFDIYRKHLKPDGVIVAHVSNRHLDLWPVLNAQAERLGQRAISVVKQHDKNRGQQQHLGTDQQQRIVAKTR